MEDGREFRLSEVFDLSWDWAYINEEACASAARVQWELHIGTNGYDFEQIFDPLNCIIFVKDGRCAFLSMHNRASFFPGVMCASCGMTIALSARGLF